MQQQLQPTAVTPTAQTVLMAWRIVICREKGIDSECNCGGSEGLRMGIQRGTDTECYCVGCEGLWRAI